MDPKKAAWFVLRNDKRLLELKVEEQRELQRRAVTAKLKGELSDSNFRLFKESSERDAKRIHEQVATLQQEMADVELLLSNPVSQSVSLVKLWSEGGVGRKQDLQRALFPKVAAYSTSHLMQYCKITRVFGGSENCAENSALHAGPANTSRVRRACLHSRTRSQIRAATKIPVGR
jgi:hypothetical protein